MSEFRRRLMMQKKEEDARHNLVEYIKTSSNNQLHIVIDYIPNRKSRIVVDFLNRSLPNSPIFYASKSGVESRCAVIVTTGVLYFATGNFQGNAPSFTLDSERAVVDLNMAQDEISVTTNTYVKKIISEQSSVYDMLAVDECIELHLFKRLDTEKYAQNVAIYSVQLYEEDNLLYDLRPFDDGDKNGLVNILTGKTYCDVYGRLFLSPITT